MSYRPNIEVIAREQYEASKQINFLDRLLKRRTTINPNPILGTDKAQQLLTELEAGRAVPLQQPNPVLHTTVYAKVDKQLSPRFNE
jgi:hypothetical protein